MPKTMKVVVPDELHAELKEDAAAAGRSLTKHIVALLAAGTSLKTRATPASGPVPHDPWVGRHLKVLAEVPAPSEQGKEEATPAGETQIAARPASGKGKNKTPAAKSTPKKAPAGPKKASGAAGARARGPKSTTTSAGSSAAGGKSPGQSPAGRNSGVAYLKTPAECRHTWRRPDGLCPGCGDVRKRV